jgi:glutathione S-transferase
MPGVDLELWHFPISHYNEKVRWALDWKRLPHRRRALSWDYVPRAWWATGQLSLPILHIDGRAVADSTAIIAELERLVPTPALYPGAPEARAQALALEEFCDEDLGHAVRAAVVGPLLYDDPAAAIATLTTGMEPSARRVIGAVVPAFRAFYVRRHKIDRAAIEAERRKVRDGMNRIAAAIGRSGYLVGDGFTVADLTAAALLAPIAQPGELEYPAPRSALVEEYRSSVAHHPALRWAVDIFRKHRGTPTGAAAAGF